MQRRRRSRQIHQRRNTPRRLSIPAADSPHFSGPAQHQIPAHRVADQRNGFEPLLRERWPRTRAPHRPTAQSDRSSAKAHPSRRRNAYSCALHSAPQPARAPYCPRCTANSTSPQARAPEPPSAAGCAPRAAASGNGTAPGSARSLPLGLPLPPTAAPVRAASDAAAENSPPVFADVRCAASAAE